jgi:hypothetical protein
VPRLVVRWYWKGAIGCPNQTILVRFACFASFFCRVCLSFSYALPTTSCFSALHHPAQLRLLNFHFPRDVGWHDARMVQGAMCQTPKTLMYTCNQTRSRLILDQQQRQPNTTGWTVWACISPCRTGSPSRLPMTKATNHAQSEWPDMLGNVQMSVQPCG